MSTGTERFDEWAREYRGKGKGRAYCCGALLGFAGGVATAVVVMIIVAIG
jgi:hypothetical protein